MSCQMQRPMSPTALTAATFSSSRFDGAISAASSTAAARNGNATSAGLIADDPNDFLNPFATMIKNRNPAPSAASRTPSVQRSASNCFPVRVTRESSLESNHWQWTPRMCGQSACRQLHQLNVKTGIGPCCVQVANKSTRKSMRDYAPRNINPVGFPERLH